MGAETGSNKNDVVEPKATVRPPLQREPQYFTPGECHGGLDGSAGWRPATVHEALSAIGIRLTAPLMNALSVTPPIGEIDKPTE